MSKVKGAGGGGSKGGGKSKSKGCGSDVAAVRHEKLLTSGNSDVVTLLRCALRNDDGSDKDLLADFPSFTTFKRNGLNLNIEFHCGKALSRADAAACFEMVKTHMEDEYDDSGYGWDDNDKWSEITSRESRLLLLRDNRLPRSAQKPDCIGFVQFRLTLQGEVWNAMEGAPCLFIYDVQLAPEYRRKGVGKQLLVTLEMMAKKAQLSYLMSWATVRSKGAEAFFLSLKGWRDDTATLMEMEAADEEDDTFRVYSKCLDSLVLKQRQETQQVQDLALQLAGMASCAEDTTSCADGASVLQPQEPAALKEKSKNAKKKARQRARCKVGGLGYERPQMEDKVEVGVKDNDDQANSVPLLLTPAKSKTGAAEDMLSAAATAVQQGAARSDCDQPCKDASEVSANVAEVKVKLPFSFGLSAAPAEIQVSTGNEQAEEQEAFGNEAVDEASSVEEGAEEPQDCIDRVLEELCELFEHKNGRPATFEEIQMWVQTMNEANLNLRESEVAR
mmetsp:Transcript_50570/g.83822  ORF Transcript_50570/g.83822 Transcript_50570/m.83822 type:complete len:503 (+) Transcript_50570:42-1550(+)|eukprot:CAMPEP_0119328512 /NCGR_PEP_ID=MMETSP1333-20130426/73517_1 /TAXON_ID=418940 /ORGANISM="Scyphosphaera apsteinii, Strain RCC1455" /LENGTH=502 /DNA_ID=CAMNT_0007337389 /DNA_START=37 /DNA_END=1545 /DNA_ORIENTATION=+